MVSLPERRRCVTYLKNEYDVSERRACQAMQLNRSSYRYVGQTEAIDGAYREVIKRSNRYPYWGYRKIYGLMRGIVQVSRERVRLIRRREGLQVVKKVSKRRVLGATTRWVNRARFPNHVWSYDFVFDCTDDKRQVKCLTVVDEFTRQALTIEVARSITANDVVRILEELFHEHGRPLCLRSDNGPEFVSRAVRTWLKDKHIGAHFIDPGSPWQNAYCESFNSIFRTTCLNRYWFSSLTEARVLIRQWLQEYNTVRPHGSLGGMSPEAFIQRWTEGKTDQQQPKLLTG